MMEQVIGVNTLRCVRGRHEEGIRKILFHFYLDLNKYKYMKDNHDDGMSEVKEKIHGRGNKRKG
jgi:hypothetical protein